MSDLVEFLRARLGEDEATAQAAIADDGGQDGGFEDAQWLTNGIVLPRFGEAAADLIRTYAVPRRVLADVAAKRRIIAEHPILTTWSVCTRCSDFREHGGEVLRKVPGPCNTLRLLALPYAGHQDFQEAWRV